MRQVTFLPERLPTSGSALEALDSLIVHCCMGICCFATSNKELKTIFRKIREKINCVNTIAFVDSRENVSSSAGFCRMVSTEPRSKNRFVDGSASAVVHERMSARAAMGA